MKKKKCFLIYSLILGLMLTACAGQQAVVEPTPEPTPMATPTPILQPTPSPSPKPYWADWDIRLSPTEEVASMPAGRTACSIEQAEIELTKQVYGSCENYDWCITEFEGGPVYATGTEASDTVMLYTQVYDQLYKLDNDYFYHGQFSEFIKDSGGNGTFDWFYINVETMQVYRELARERDYSNYMVAPWPEDEGTTSSA